MYKIFILWPGSIWKIGTTSITTASKYITKWPRICINWNPLFQTFLQFEFFFQEKKKESEFTVPTKPVRGKTTNQPAEKSESFKIYSDNSLKSEPTSSSLLEDTKMLLQVRFFKTPIKKKCIFRHFMKWNEKPEIWFHIQVQQEQCPLKYLLICTYSDD